MSEHTTNPTIFLRLRHTDAAPREFAWAEFHERYAPIIAAFSRRLGLRQQDVDDVVQDVLVGFFSRSPSFQYDPGKGRFRGYLKMCTCHATQRRMHAQSKHQAKELNTLSEVAIDHLWEDIWEAELLRQTVNELRKEMGETKTFLAFERYVMFEEPANQVADALQIHLNSVYRAKEQMVRTLQERLASRRQDEG